jgi:hypothetical protein
MCFAIDQVCEEVAKLWKKKRARWLASRGQNLKQSTPDGGEGQASVAGAAFGEPDLQEYSGKKGNSGNLLT